MAEADQLDQDLNLELRALPRSFFERDTRLVACELLGKVWVLDDERGRRIARIVETEAYLGPQDQAAHSRRGITPRTRVMFGPAGHAYVYLIYGMHHCLNLVAGAPGSGCAVLIRAVEAVEGIEGNTAGPGRLCKAMDIDRSYNGLDACTPSFFLADASPPSYEELLFTPRIGIDYAGAWASPLLRYGINDHPCLSRRAPRR